MKQVTTAAKQLFVVVVLSFALVCVGHTNFIEATDTGLGVEEQQADDDAMTKRLQTGMVAEVDRSPNYYVLEFEFDGKQISIPYYHTSVKLITAARRKFESRALEKSRTLFNETAYAAIYRGKTVGLLPNLQKAIKLFSGTRCEYLDLDEASLVPPLTLDFNRRAYDAWAEAQRKGNEAWDKEQGDLKRSGRRAVKANKEETKQFIEKIDILYQIAIEVVKRSRLGIYMDWFNLQIDGQQIEDYASSYVTFLRRNGHNAFLSLTDRVARVLRDMDWQSTSTPKLFGIPLTVAQNFIMCAYVDDEGKVLRKVGMDKLVRKKKEARENERRSLASNTGFATPTTMTASTQVYGAPKSISL